MIYWLSIKKLKNPIHLYPKRIKSYNSDLIEFGRFPKDKPEYRTRRVDILVREIDVSKHKNLIDILNNFISSHNHWGKKAAIGIWPYGILGKIIFK